MNEFRFSWGGKRMKSIDVVQDISERLQERMEYYGDDKSLESKAYKEVLEIIESDTENLQDEAYRVLYKGINGGFQLSDDMDFDAACQFRNKCLDMGYDTAYVIQIVE